MMMIIQLLIPLGHILAAAVMWSSLVLFVLKVLWNLCVPYAAIHEGIRHPENAHSWSLFTFIELALLLLATISCALGNQHGAISCARLGAYGLCAIFITYVHMMVVGAIALHCLGPFPKHPTDRDKEGSSD
jgi:hypothetical protein